MNSTEILRNPKIGFDTVKYYREQKNAIVKRLQMFSSGRLYLEIGGKFLYDPNAARVLPGFDPAIKQKIFADLKDLAEILFCVDAPAIISNRQLKNVEENYIDTVVNMLLEIEKNLNIKPIIVINRCSHKNEKSVENYIKSQEKKGYQVYKRYMIEGYPKSISTILSKDGFGRDEYIKLEKNLILVTGAASNSGKLSTCLGQIYHDEINGAKSGYAKYELFPIWNLPLNHPVNLSYEAATADIGDFNVNDKLHKKVYGVEAVNYNRDYEAFKLLNTLADKFTSSDNPIRSYNSTTDMGINMAGFAITDDKVVCEAAVEEILRRKEWYKEIIERGEGKMNWVLRCEQLEREAKKYNSKILNSNS
jgi:uncharacterized protein (UPF0371 family)